MDIKEVALVQQVPAILGLRLLSYPCFGDGRQRPCDCSQFVCFSDVMMMFDASGALTMFSGLGELEHQEPLFKKWVQVVEGLVGNKEMLHKLAGMRLLRFLIQNATYDLLQDRAAGWYARLHRCCSLPMFCNASHLANTTVLSL